MQEQQQESNIASFKDFSSLSNDIVSNIVSNDPHVRKKVTAEEFFDGSRKK